MRQIRVISATVIIASCLASAIVVGEFVRRGLDGYRFDSLVLTPSSQPANGDRAVSREYLEKAARTLISDGGLDLDLFNQSPPEKPRGDTLPLLQERARTAKTSTYHVNFVFNRSMLLNGGASNYIADDFPEEIFVFTSPDGSNHPRYRHYPNTRLTINAVTNSLGWRSAELSIDKPARTIRIAGLGDSTTMHQGDVTISYLDFLCHWLGLWARNSGHQVKFECMNTGREAISSEDVVSILKYEVRPLEPDYLLFYGLGNQWDIHSLVEVYDDVGWGWSSAEKYYRQGILSRSIASILKQTGRYSATTLWLENRLNSGINDRGREPSKPAQKMTFPSGVSEHSPDPYSLPKNSPIKRAIRDLDSIRSIASEDGTQLLLLSFKYLVSDGMILPMPAASGIFNYLNYGYFPYKYGNLRRAIDFLNRNYLAWAEKWEVPFIPVAELMPDDYRFFSDAMHNTQTGVRLRAWAVFQQILPRIKSDLEAGRFPRPDRTALQAHPFPVTVQIMKKSDIPTQRK